MRTEPACVSTSKKPPTSRPVTLPAPGERIACHFVADRAVGLKMRVLAYDPYLTEARAVALGVEKVELDDLLTRLAGNVAAQRAAPG